MAAPTLIEQVRLNVGGRKTKASALRHEIVYLYLAGHKSGEISRNLGLSRSTVIFQLNKAGVELSSKILSPELERTVVDEYLNFKNTKDLSKKFSVSDDTIINTLKRNGVYCGKYRPRTVFDVNACNLAFVENDENCAYFIGLLLTDGWIAKNTFSIMLKAEDKYILQKLKEYVGCGTITDRERHDERTGKTYRSST